MSVDSVPQIHVDRDRITVSDGDARLHVRELLELRDEDGTVTTVPIAAVESDADGVLASATTDRLDAGLRLRVDGGVVTATLEVSWHGPAATAGLRVQAHLDGGVTAPRWLVPACFYRENRPKGTAGAYPRAVVQGGRPEAFDSSWWSFRADRAATPAVFGWSDTTCGGIAATHATPVGMSGIGFAAEPAPRIWVDLPFREEPVVYRGDPDPSPPNVAHHRWEPGQRHRFALLLWVGPPDPHAYVPLLRAGYARDRAAHPLAPWMDAAAGAELTAHGLHAWHWRPEHDALFETAAFDRAHPDLDRPSMHVAWVSGIPWAQTLLAYGRRGDDHRYVEAGTRVIDHICANLTPAGTFWGEWRRDRGWGCGWNRDPDRLHARTLAEATLFTLRAVRAERADGMEHPDWIAAAASNLDRAVASADETGNLGSYYHQATGEVVDRRGAAGLLWVAALVEGADVLGRPELLAVAERAGGHYAHHVEEAFVHGAPEDVHLAPTSEDAYNAVLAYVALHRATGDQRWLGLARLAADWTMTFRWSYNIEFGAHTILRAYDFRTRGADNASPPNQHLHAYGLIVLPELMYLWRATGDDYFHQRAQDNLACFLQLIAREDGDFNARRGMVTERYYHTDCFQPKGSILTLSHAWCVGVTLMGCQAALDDPELLPA
ncbi:hypothetical protein [Egicoccus sp. AB-alg6-2]|uniref:hypothetical protein n=1 Tax=Egicoccus sp. AB-alg6-2 TaxID=3242692 RepID=UPI00359E5A95